MRRAYFILLAIRFEKFLHLLINFHPTCFFNTLKF